MSISFCHLFHVLCDLSAFLIVFARYNGVDNDRLITGINRFRVADGLETAASIAIRLNL
jgi:hypothetical protein